MGFSIRQDADKIITLLLNASKPITPQGFSKPVYNAFEYTPKGSKFKRVVFLETSRKQFADYGGMIDLMQVGEENQQGFMAVKDRSIRITGDGNVNNCPKFLKDIILAVYPNTKFNVKVNDFSR